MLGAAPASSLWHATHDCCSAGRTVQRPDRWPVIQQEPVSADACTRADVLFAWLGRPLHPKLPHWPGMRLGMLRDRTIPSIALGQQPPGEELLREAAA